MAPGQKYSVKISNAELDSYKETFMMFDKVAQEDPIIIIIGMFSAGW
jgi:hypothetical protein